MHCPRCHTAELAERNRDGVLIDICTACRGVWLDRGELDKLIALASERGDDRRDDNNDDDDERPRGDPRARHRGDDDDEDDDRRGRGRGRSRWWDIFD